ncbi:hypothetical protein B566_EDAN012386, partial [Ephemera danica]
MGGEQPESELVRTEQAVEVLLRRIKHCSKYLKDVITYVEKRAHLDLEYAKNLAKLAQTVRPLINEEPMNARRNEHEKRRKQLKEQWQRENKRLQEAEATKRKAYALLLQRQQSNRGANLQSDTTLQSQSDATPPQSGSTPTGRSEKRRKAEEEAAQKTSDAETAYKAACIEVDERTQHLQTTKADILNSLQGLLFQYDQTLKLSTMNYFQLQQAMSTSIPTQ